MNGQLIKRGNGWTVRVYMGRDAHTGKRKYLNRSVKGTKKDANQVLTALLRQRDLGDLGLDPIQLTVEQYLEEWKEKALRPRVRPRTFDDYVGNLNRYVMPAIGNRLLTSIRPLDVQGVIASMRDRGLSPRSVRYCHTVLSNAFRQAVRWQYLRSNPAQAVELPRRTHREMRAMTPEEARRFLEAAEGSPHYLMFALLLATGMRPGEAVALKWSDLDPTGRTLTVRRSASTTNRGVVIDQPKTARSRRSIALPEHLGAMLLAHRGDAADDSFMFPSRAGTPLDIANLRSQHFKPILERAGLAGFRLYGLRHTHATLLLAAGENPKIVSERLGHAGVTLTLDVYSHVLPGMQTASAKKVDAMLFGSPPTDCEESDK